MNKFYNYSIKYAISALLLVVTTIFGLSCVGQNPPQAPFGSTVEIVNPPDDINIPPNTITIQVVEALVTDPEGQPLNDVLVEWRLFGTGVNDLLFDTDGDGVPDVGGLQIIDNEACDGPLKCSQIEIPELLGNPLFRDAFVDTPFPTLTNSFGVSEISLLITGDVVFDPTTLEVSLLNGTTDNVEISLNN